MQEKSQYIKFTFSEKATKIDKIFTNNLTVCSNHEIEGEDLVNFCGFLKKHKRYPYPAMVIFCIWVPKDLLNTLTVCNMTNRPPKMGPKPL